jgi:Flp pilus assembly pilin Flp
MLVKLWNDEAGAIVASEIILIATILVIGIVTGLSSVRDAVIEELADVGAAIGSVNQSYQVSGSESHSATAAGSQFVDTADFCDGATNGTGAQCNSRCVTIGGAAPEGPHTGA